MTHAPEGILFLCVANSSRSQMAEGFARALAGGRLIVQSAGSAPTRLHPHAVRVMQEIGIDISRQHAKSLGEVDFSQVDTLVTLCADEGCPVLPKPVRRLHWALEDPAAVCGSEDVRLAAFRRVRDETRRRVEELLRAEPRRSWAREP